MKFSIKDFFSKCDQIRRKLRINGKLHFLCSVIFRGRNFPRRFKDSQSYSFFKAGDGNDFGNYQPISVLSCFSKIFESVMYKRFFNNLLEHNLLN